MGFNASSLKTAVTNVVSQPKVVKLHSRQLNKMKLSPRVTHFTPLQSGLIRNINYSSFKERILLVISFTVLYFEKCTQR